MLTFRFLHQSKQPDRIHLLRGINICYYGKVKTALTFVWELGNRTLDRQCIARLQAVNVHRC